jgi:hypothetical protein
MDRFASVEAHRYIVNGVLIQDAGLPAWIMTVFAAFWIYFNLNRLDPVARSITYSAQDDRYFQSKLPQVTNHET